MFRKLDLFPSSDDEREMPTLLGPLEKAGPVIKVSFSKIPNRVGVSLPLPVDGNRYSVF
jgi:hypothetical protein